VLIVQLLKEKYPSVRTVHANHSIYMYMYCEKDSSHQSSYYEVNYYVHKVYLMLNVFLISYVMMIVMMMMMIMMIVMMMMMMMQCGG
jgi:hypothetical protein